MGSKSDGSPLIVLGSKGFISNQRLALVALGGYKVMEAELLSKYGYPHTEVRSE
jgi:hypothetical protein